MKAIIARCEPACQTPANSHAHIYTTSRNVQQICLDNSFELSGVFQRVLDNLVARRENVLFALCQFFLLSREVNTTLLGNPATRLGELDDGTFGVEEEEVLCVGDGKGGVCALAA